MDISLIICTRNRSAQLERALEAVSKTRTDCEWELVVVDNASGDSTRTVVEAFRRRMSFLVHYCREDTPGLSRARARGIEASEGKVVSFTDDDCYVAEDFVSAVWRSFNDKSIGYLGGRILLYDDSDLRLTTQESTWLARIEPCTFILPGVIQGANFSLDRNAVGEVGGFDSRLGHGTLFPCEDIDIVARISAAGWTGLYDPRPTVFHHHGRKTSAEERRIEKAYAIGRGAYYLKCLQDPRLRAAYARGWFTQVVRHLMRFHWIRLFHEIHGAILFERMHVTKS